MYLGQRVRPTTSNLHRAMLAVLLFVFFLGHHSFAQEDDDSPEAGRKRLQKLSEETAERAKRSRTGQRGLFPVPADAIKESRGETEDRLRMNLLALFSPGETRDKIKDIINRPWDDDTVRDLWEVSGDRHRGPSGDIFNLVVFAAKKYGGQVFMEVKSKLNDLFDKFNDPDWRPSNYKMGAMLWTALGKYGTPDLLPASFWAGMEREGMGSSQLKILRRIGDKDTLTWLEDFQETCPWQEQKNLDRLRETIEELRAKFSKTSDQGKRPEMEKRAGPISVEAKKMLRMKDLVVLIDQHLAAGEEEEAMRKFQQLKDLYREVELGGITKELYKEQMIKTWQVAQEMVVPKLREIELKRQENARQPKAEKAEPQPKLEEMPKPKPQNKPVPKGEVTHVEDEGIKWLVPGLIIAVIALAGIMVFLLLRRKGQN